MITFANPRCRLAMINGSSVALIASFALCFASQQAAQAASAAEVCQTAAETVQRKTDELEELRIGKSSIEMQVQVAWESLSFPTLVSLLEAQVATHRSIVAVWETIASTVRGHSGCWPPRMASRLAVKAEEFAADARQAVQHDTLMRDQARATAKSGWQSR